MGRRPLHCLRRRPPRLSPSPLGNGSNAARPHPQPAAAVVALSTARALDEETLDKESRVWKLVALQLRLGHVTTALVR